jgi:hypothetical protein
MQLGGQGGWGQFLFAREAGKHPQPRLAREGSHDADNDLVHGKKDYPGVPKLCNNYFLYSRPLNNRCWTWN